MDTTSTIIGVLFLAVMVIPIILLNNAHRKKEKELRNSLRILADQYHLTTNEQDMWRNGIIGIDRTNKKVLFCRKEKKAVEKTVIDLQEVKACRTLNTSRSVDVNNGVEKPVDKLEIVISWKNTAKPETYLEFFNANDSLQMGHIQQLADKWAAVINDNHMSVGKTG